MIKVDACSLIYTIKLGLLEKIIELYEEIIISPRVKIEVIDQGKKRGYPDAIIAEQYLFQKKIKVHKPKSPIKMLNLGIGETEILSLALEENSPCIIDDIRAQKIGIKLKIDLKSTPIILLELLRNSYLTLQNYYEYIENYGRIANLSQNELWFFKKLGELMK